MGIKLGIVALLFGLGMIIYAITLVQNLKKGRPVPKGTNKTGISITGFLGVLFVGIGILCIILKDRTPESTTTTHHELYKDFTYDEWKNEADEALAKYRKNTSDMDKGMYELQGVAMQMVLSDGDEFKNDLDLKANLTHDQVEQLKQYWDTQWEATRNAVNAQIEANDRKNYPNKY
jgi:hypothetical protein